MPTDCHWVQHAAGRACVPTQIERLVTLDTTSFENAVALGLQPIATVDTHRFNSLLEEHLADVVNLGQVDEPNIERVLTLKPDLILMLDYQPALYAQVSQIAPTIFIEFEHSGLWKEVFREYSRVLGREDIGQQVLDNYDRRLQEFKQQREAEQQGNLTSSLQVSAIRIYPDRVNLYFRESFPGTVLDDAGLSRPEGQDITASEARRRYQNPIQASISLEQLDQADGDVIFVWIAQGEIVEEETAQQRLAKLQANPLWRGLKAVQNNQIYVVPSYWVGNGPLAAKAMIDDLFKYLLEDS
ncbi:MAG: iron-siderophore ABC transporter substrate-binding protein [Cyanobacteria bacterium P01_D01_bin.56]